MRRQRNAGLRKAAEPGVGPAAAVQGISAWFFLGTCAILRPPPDSMSNQFSWVTRFLERPHLIVAPVALLFLFVFVALGIGHGEFFSVGLIVGGLVAVALALIMGRSYWLLIPLAFSAELPAIPLAGRLIELAEAAIVLCTAVFILRMALRQQRLTVFRMSHAPALMFTAWAMFIFWENPVWLSVASGELGGARFYAKIVMALAAFLIMANQEIGERESRWIILLVLVGAGISTVRNIAAFFIPALGGDAAMAASAVASANAVMETDSYYSWHQYIAGVPITVIVLLLSRYKAREIFTLERIRTLGLFLVCAVLVLLSGKRAGVASVPAYAVVATIIRKEFGYLALWLGGAVTAAILLVAGHGSLFHLPLTAQRALSWLPGQWDPELQSLEGGQDEFRSTLRRLAWEKIQRDPWIGQGYRVDMALIQQSMDIGGGGVEGQVLPFALGSAWHNTWLGYAADLGIPASILAGLIFLTFIKKGWRLSTQLPAGSWPATLAMYITLVAILRLLTSHTSGHSANDQFERWWMYGILVSLAVKAAKDREAAASTGETSSPRSGEPLGLALPGLAPLRAGEPRRARRPTSVDS